MEVYGKYLDPNNANWSASLTTLVGQIAAGAGSSVIDGASYLSSTTSFPFAGLLNTSSSTGGPKAYLNWLVFDRNYNFIPGKSGYQRMSTTAKEAGTDVAHEKLASPDIIIGEPGYVYVYLSNEETSPVEVYFDDFKVTQMKSPVIQTDDYFPFGMVSQSYQRENSVPNKYLFNGKEQINELSLGVYDYGARMYDPAIGRWGVIDQKAELYKNITPYAYCANQPTNAIDPDGKLVIFINGFTTTTRDQGTPWYWRQYEMQSVPNTHSWAALGGFQDNHYEPVQTGRAFDLEVSQQLGDENRRYVHGGNILGSGSRSSSGEDLGYKDAPDIIASLHRTGGVIDESIKFITHSMGGVYGDGYISGLKKYLNEHPELRSQVSIVLIADFDPFQAKQIKNDGSIKKQQFTHKGKGSATGWLANQDEEGPHDIKESSSDGSHSIFSFFNNIQNLQAGTYKWNEQTGQLELQPEKKK